MTSEEAPVMAYTFQQQSTIRKFVYFGLILLLFTGSLLHRKFVINAQADELQMRESARGKADLTDSALRLTLSGVRGVAVTSLWLAVIDRQKRHEWTEMEVLVDSLTRLQPRFTSPWLFQGWNLAFNVAVECDRPHDKYYYITRGITLLCRGEEKNDPGMAVPPQPWPANPEMRFQVGFTYQLKIGQGDENKTLRCLFELSCIPVSERTPNENLWWRRTSQGKEVNREWFLGFCKKYPRLIRRLKERLTGYSSPEDIVGFLEANKDIPGRIEDRTKLDDDKRLEEFPILPPSKPEITSKIPAQQQYPDWHAPSLSKADEEFDVFICIRAWYTYAQLPLPPANKDPGIDEPPLDRLLYRLPKMSTIIFRSYPARAEAYFGENLQIDGWFDGSGWLVKNWFNQFLPADQKSRGYAVGEGDRFNSGKAWGRAYDLYLDYGVSNGLYIEPKERAQLEKEKLQGANSRASKKLFVNELNRGMTNFDALFFQCKVERTAEAVAARKLIFEANRIIQANDYAKALDIYRQEALPQWLDLLMRYPEFRNISTIQEETYELQAEYFKLFQLHYKEDLSKLLLAVPQLAVGPQFGLSQWEAHRAWARRSPPQLALWPQVGFVGVQLRPQLLMEEMHKQKKFKIFPIRDMEGPFDQLFILDVPEEHAPQLKALAEVLARQVLWPPPKGAGTPDYAFARFVVWPPPSKKAGPPEIGLGTHAAGPLVRYVGPNGAVGTAGLAVAADWPQPLFLLLSSAEQRRILTIIASHRHPPAGLGWTPLIPLPVVEQSRERITWMRRPPPPAMPAPAPPPGKGG
jgi:hypothetical protein